MQIGRASSGRMGLRCPLVCHFFKGKEVDWTLMAGTGLEQVKRERKQFNRAQRDQASTISITTILSHLRKGRSAAVYEIREDPRLSRSQTSSLIFYSPRLYCFEVLALGISSMH